jgi:hypothetical protein
VIKEQEDLDISELMILSIDYEPRAISLNDPSLSFKYSLIEWSISAIKIHVEFKDPLEISKLLSPDILNIDIL